jgi:hypothetical protein
MPNFSGDMGSAAAFLTTNAARRFVGGAQVREPLEAAATQRQEQQRQAVERFNHKTFRSDWDALLRELYVRVVDGCPFAVGLFYRDASRSQGVLREMLNYNGAREPMVDYVRIHFKLAHYEHITGSLRGLAPHERFDLYKIVSPGMGLPVNSLVYRIEHYTDPALKAVMVFGGERLGGQMETHLKMATGLLERASADPAVRSTDGGNDSRARELIAALRATDLRRLRRTKLSEHRRAAIHEMVTKLGDIQEQFPQALQAKYVLLSKFLEENPAPAPAPSGEQPPEAPRARP